MSEITPDVLKMFTGALDVPASVTAYKVPAIADLTWEDVKKMSGQQLKNIRQHEGGPEKIDQILADRAAQKGVKVAEAIAAETEEARAAAVAKAEAEAVAGTTLEVPAEPAATEPTAEEKVAAEAVVAAEAARVAAEAETARVAAEAAVKALQDAEAAKTPKVYVYEYQVRDAEGNPVGNKTRLVANSLEELEEKKQESYRQAVLAIDRLKKQKPTFKQPEPTQISQAELDAAAKDITSEDPTVRASAVRKIARAEAETERAKFALEAENARQAKESYVFMREHVNDYNNCEANNTMLAQFILDNKLEWTADNLNIALGNLESQLAPVIRRDAPPVPVSEPAAVNPAPPAQPAATATAVPAAAPAVPAAPASTPAAAVPVAPAAPAAPAANPAPAVPARRPGVNAGLVPGSSLHGVAPQAKSAAETRKDLIKELRSMSAEEMKRRHKLDPKFYDKVNAALGKK